MAKKLTAGQRMIASAKQALAFAQGGEKQESTALQRRVRIFRGATLLPI